MRHYNHITRIQKMQVHNRVHERIVQSMLVHLQQTEFRVWGDKKLKNYKE